MTIIVDSEKKNRVQEVHKMKNNAPNSRRKMEKYRMKDKKVSSKT